MQDADFEEQRLKKKELLKAFGALVYTNRQKLNKGINTFSYEYDIGNGLLSRLEKGLTDTKITTLWKLSNAFGYKCSEFIKMIEDCLPEDFDFYN